MTYSPPPPPDPFAGDDRGAAYPAVPPNSGTAIGALVCAALSFVAVPLVLAVVALVLAATARREIEASGGRLGGDTMVKAAVVLAWVNIALCVLAAIVIFLVFGFVVSSTDSVDVRTNVTSVGAALARPW